MSHWEVQTMIKSQSETTQNIDLSQDKDFLTSLLTWKNGRLLNILNSIVNLNPVMEFVQEETTSIRKWKSSIQKKESSNATQISTFNFKNVSEASETTKNHADEEVKIGVGTPIERKMVDLHKRILCENSGKEPSETKGRKRIRRQRMDVVFKTVLRAIRRYYTKMYKVIYPQTRRLTQRPTIMTQVGIMKSFVGEVFQLKSPKDDLVYFVMGLINNKLFESCARGGYVTPKLWKDVKEMFECTYNFKMGVFKKVVSHGAVKNMLANMLNSGLDSIISSEKAMSKNPILYKEAFEKFFKITL